MVSGKKCQHQIVLLKPVYIEQKVFRVSKGGIIRWIVYFPVEVSPGLFEFIANCIGLNGLGVEGKNKTDFSGEWIELFFGLAHFFSFNTLVPLQHSL